MEIRQPIHSEHARTLDTAGLRRQFLVEVPFRPDAVVFHMPRRAHETHHLVVRNGQAVIRSSWSIHSGVGMRACTFIRGMVGEHQVFKDMDPVAMTTLQ